MGLRRDILVSRRPAAGLAAIGIFWGSVAAWLPDIKARAGVGDAQFGLLMMLSAVGGMIAMALAPRMAARFGPGVLPASGLIVAAVTLLPALVGGPLSLGLAVLAIGAAMSFCDILSNIRISIIEGREGRSLQNLNHALFSLGLAASAFAMGLARKAGVPHGVALIPVALIVLALVVLMRGGRSGDTPAEEDSGTGAVAPWMTILPGAAILWLCFLAENGTESWAAIHIERSLGAAGGLGAFGPAMFALAMGLARLAGQASTRVLGEVRLIAVSVCAALLGAVALALAPGLGLAIAGAAALGLGLAVVVPTANSLIARTVPPEARASAISGAWLLGFTGFFIGPPVIGMVAEGAGLRVAFGLIALMVALMLPSLGALARRLR